MEGVDIGLDSSWGPENVKMTVVAGIVKILVLLDIAKALDSVGILHMVVEIEGEDLRNEMVDSS